MLSEINRPTEIDGVIGHLEAKQKLKTYLQSETYKDVILLNGPPGCGKTTLANAAANTYGFEAHEINASLKLRSHQDVESIIQDCSHTLSILSIIRKDHKKKCLILDEVDGSDPHAQKKLKEWLLSKDRKIPVVMTCNEVPLVFKTLNCVRCFPPNIKELELLFPKLNVSHLAKKYKYDIRRIIQSIQYGESDELPPPINLSNYSPEISFILKQKTWFSINSISQKETWTEKLSRRCPHSK
jgi:DNA polymerase III delta prime subunit